jgi:hypothetical protein
LDEKRLRALTLLNFFEAEELAQIEDPALFDLQLNEEFADLVESPEFSELPTEIDTQEFIERLNSDDQTEKEQCTKQLVIAIYSSFASFFNYLSLMVHGRSMVRLIADATEGDDQAFALAVQTDRTVLSLPYFQERMLKAQFSSDSSFLNTLSYRLRNPILKGKIRYRTLWITFSVLDDEGLLNQPHDVLFDICEHLGVYGKEHGIEDVGHISSRLREYRRFQTK